MPPPFSTLKSRGGRVLSQPLDKMTIRHQRRETVLSAYKLNKALTDSPVSCPYLCCTETLKEVWGRVLYYPTLEHIPTLL